MVAIHCFTRPFEDGGLDGVSRQLEHSAELGSFQAAEITQNIVLGPTPFGSPDTHAATQEVR